MSLVLLYDNWQRANGHASMFFPSANTQQAAPAGGASGAAAQGDVPKANASATRVPRRRARCPAAPQAAAQPTGEKVVVTTDDLRAEIDTAGGILSRLEMLKHHEKDGKPVVLFERDANRTYMARSGLIGGDLPNHTTVFTVAPGPRTLDGKDKLEVVLTAEKSGVKFVKTYIFHKGSYVVDAQLRRDQRRHGADLADAVPGTGARRQQGRAVAVLQHLHWPGHLHRCRQVSQAELRRHRQGQGHRAGCHHQRLGGDGAAVLRLRLDSAGRQAAQLLRRADRPEPVPRGHPAAAGSDRAGRHGDHRCPPVRRSAGRAHARADHAGPGAGEGLWLADHPRQAAVLAAREAARRAGQLGLVDHRADGADQAGVLPAVRGELQVHGQDEGPAARA